MFAPPGSCEGTVLSVYRGWGVGRGEFRLGKEAASWPRGPLHSAMIPSTTAFKSGLRIALVEPSYRQPRAWGLDCKYADQSNTLFLRASPHRGGSVKFGARPSMGSPPRPDGRNLPQLFSFACFWCSQGFAAGRGEQLAREGWSPAPASSHPSLLRPGSGSAPEPAAVKVSLEEAPFKAIAGAASENRLSL